MPTYPHPLRAQLDALPPPPLPPGLWPRLARRRKRQLAVRRAGMALAIGVLAAGPLALLRPAQDAPAPTIVAAPGIAPGNAADALPAIDQALQNAYARGASDDEIAPLWDVRQRLARQARAPSPTDPS